MIDCQQESPPIQGCLAGTVQDIRDCLAMGENAILSQDIVVDASDCDGPAVLNLAGIEDLDIYGQGFKLLRTSGQADCSLVSGDATTSGVTFTDVGFEEVPGPDVPELNTYPDMLLFEGSQDICFDNAEVAHSWGVALRVRDNEGFKFNNSIMRDAGALGLYIGEQSNISTNATITNSTFECNTTNALAIRGVDGLLVDGNLFNDNHKLGVFPIPGGYTGGGQFYFLAGTNAVITNNTIQNGFCQNCVTAGVLNNPVSGLEMGLNGLDVTNTLIEFNTIQNNTAYAFRLNSNAQLDTTTVIRNNTLANNGSPNVLVGGADYTP